MKYRIMPYNSTVGICENNNILIFGMSSDEARYYIALIESELSLSEDRSEPDKQKKGAIDSRQDKVFTTNRTGKSQRGRKLILESYLSIVHEIVTRDKGISPHEIAKILKKRGAVFSNTTAVANLLTRLVGG